MSLLEYVKSGDYDAMLLYWFVCEPGQRAFTAPLEEDFRREQRLYRHLDLNVRIS
jgi:hypothetical protein